ncbi:unnamed protein product, partial [Effrenium voratum]
MDAHCLEREVAANRVWKDLVGHEGFSLQRWFPETERADPHQEFVAGPLPTWVTELLAPVLSALPQLSSSDLRMRRVRDDEIWLADASRHKELRIQKEPPVVEVYAVVEHGRHFYRTMVFTSDTAWSFHSPAGKQLLLRAGTNWRVAAGDVADLQATHSVVI